jgi:hypothetical protein
MPMDRTAYYADASTPASIAAITAAMADAEADHVWGLEFADAAARAAAIPSPVQGMRSKRADCATDEVYWDAYNASTNPTSPLLVAGWLSTVPSGRFKGTMTSSKTVTAGNKWGISTGPTFDSVDDPDSGFNTTTGQFRVQKGGTYTVLGEVKNAGSGVSNNYLKVSVNGTAKIQTGVFPNAAFGGGQLVGYLRLLPGDLVEVTNGITYTSQSDSPADNNFFELVQVQF